MIRNLTIEDYDSVYELWLRCSGMGLNDRDDSREGISRYLSRNPDTCFAAIEEGRIVGAILSGHDGRRGTICHTAVDPDYRHRGIGTMLVEHVLTAMKQQQITKVNLVVFGKNEAGNAFWKRMGFTKRDDLVYRNRALTDLVRIDT